MEKCVYLSEVMRMNDINELNIEVKYSENTEKETKEIETKVFIKLEHMLNRFNEAHAPFTLRLAYKWEGDTRDNTSLKYKNAL